MTASSDFKAARLIEVDALRGVAAIMVMLFHYTTRYDQLFVHTSAPLFNVPWGHLGVNLFFMISGFVIFMTLDRTKHPIDFIVSRFSRLYPVFWVAVWTTFALTWLLNLPGKGVSLSTAVTNMLMFHGLFGIKHVDGVYWTLEVELLFYAAMLALWSCGALRRPHAILAAWLSLRVLYIAIAQFEGVDLPYIVSRFLILQYVPYFIVGIVIFLTSKRGGRAAAADIALAAYALFAILAGEGATRLGIALVLGALLYVAAMRPPSMLRLPVMLWLGSISYPLYLMHENIGWGTILVLESRGVNVHVAIACAMGLSFAFAAGLHRCIEMPAMTAIRDRHKARTMGKPLTTFRPWAWTNSIAALLGAIMVSSFIVRPVKSERLSGLENFPSIQKARTEPIPCREPDGPAPFVVLALGQSNAGNHGVLLRDAPAIKVYWNGQCYRTRDPLPGATGTGGSLWPWLISDLEEKQPGRPILLAVLAVDATEIAVWSAKTALSDRLFETLAGLTTQGLGPDVILWQQGEADAALGTTAEEYHTRLVTLVASIRSRAIDAPFLVARSSRCNDNGHGVIARAQGSAADTVTRIAAGPNTDSLRAGFRSDGCHLNSEGLRAAARLWEQAIDDAAEHYPELK